MAATTAGALKSYIEGLGLGVAVFRDHPKDSSKLPYIRILDGVSITLDADGDTGDHSQEQGATELVQVDLWQQWRQPTVGQSLGPITENYQLPGQLVKRLNGAVLTEAPTHVYGVLVDSAVRDLERTSNLVHHSITVRVRRNL